MDKIGDTGFTIDDAFASNAFRLLAQGMNERHALDIVVTLQVKGLPGAWIEFERWAGEQLRDQENG